MIVGTIKMKMDKLITHLTNFITMFPHHRITVCSALFHHTLERHDARFAADRFIANDRRSFLIFTGLLGSGFPRAFQHQLVNVHVSLHLLGQPRLVAGAMVVDVTVRTKKKRIQYWAWAHDRKMINLSCLPILRRFWAIKCSCEDGRSPVSASCVTISYPDLLSSSENGLIMSYETEKVFSDWDPCQKDIGGIYFTKKRRAETIQPGLEFDNFKHRCESGIFKCISWLNGSFFGSYDRGFLKEGVKTYLMTPMSPLNSPAFSLSSHL